MKRLIAVIIVGIIIIAIFGLIKSEVISNQALLRISSGGKWLLPLVITASIVDSINPCAFSVLLLTIAFLFSLGKLRSKILAVGGVYIAGVFIIYILIGLGILRALYILNTPHFMARIGATLIIIGGAINVLGEIFPSFPIKLAIPQAAHYKMAKLIEKASVPTAFVLGIAVGMFEFPCTGGPYLLVLGLLHDSQTYMRGLGYLILYNLIFVLPLAVILLIASDELLLGKAQEWRSKNTKKMRLYGGLIMILLGILIFLL